jgi:hypothetical protein
MFVLKPLSADESRSQPILEAKGEQETTQIAPMLSPATIEGKAVSDALIEVSFLFFVEMTCELKLMLSPSARS